MIDFKLLKALIVEAEKNLDKPLDIKYKTGYKKGLKKHRIISYAIIDINVRINP